MPAKYFDKTADLLPFIFYTEAQVYSSPYIHKNEKDQCNNVLTSTYKNLLRSNRRNGLVPFSKTDQKRPLCCNSLTKQICVCVYTHSHSSLHVQCNWKDVGKATEAHLQQYKLNTIHLIENPTE